MLRRCAPWLILAWLFALPSMAREPQPGEYILCSGGPALRQWEELRSPDMRHDRWWGNFVRSARVRFEQLQPKAKAGTVWTWLVYRGGYERRAREDGQPLVDFCKSVREKFHLNLVWLDTGEDLIRYINQGSARQPRAGLPIVGFEYFGHSNKHCFMLDYSSSHYAVSSAWLHETDLARLDRRAFARRAYCQSWGCHTGESMSRFWKRATGQRMIGAEGKTDYSNGHLRNWQVALAEGARWVR
jgi:hypothetical protein